MGTLEKDFVGEQKGREGTAQAGLNTTRSHGTFLECQLTSCSGSPRRLGPRAEGQAGPAVPRDEEAGPPP